MKEAAASRILGAVIAGLEAVENGTGVDDYLDHNLAVPELRRTVSNLLFGHFRHRAGLERKLAQLVRRPPKPALRRLLLTVMTQLDYSNGIAPESAVNVAVDYARAHGGKAEAGFVNAVLRRARELPPETDISPESLFPAPVLKRWKKQFNATELQHLAAALLAEAGNTFRCRHGRELSDSEMAALSCRALPGVDPYWTFYEIGDPTRLLNDPGWNAGRFYIQDPATAAAPGLPDYRTVQSALDLCAAPGGKTLMLAEKLTPPFRLVATDRSARRQELTRENFRRWDIQAEIIAASPEEFGPGIGEFDLVLADVPCSNSGVFRRRPDALWRFDVRKLPELFVLQDRLLAAAARHVAPGGQLVYSTCSIDDEENSGRITVFLANHPDFEAVSERRLLPDAAHDGAYCCLLRRNVQSIRK